MTLGQDLVRAAPSAMALKALLQLEPLTAELPERELIQQGLEVAQATTDSCIGYLHYLNDDGNTIELGVWSAATRGYCTAVYDRHYPIETAGIWADSARLGQPCIHNDYPNTPNRHGMPEGHSPLQRHLGVPVLEGGRARLLVGVGNKASDYDAADVAVLQLVAERVWSLVRQRRSFERYLDMERRLQRVQEIAAVCGWEYDIGDDRLHVDAMFARLFRSGAGAALPGRLAQLLDHIVPADRERLRDLLLPDAAAARGVLQLTCRRADGREFPAEFKVEFRPREVGEGMIAVGIVQDVSEQLEVEDLRRRAEQDALTGLPNRHRLERLFEQGSIGRRGAQRGFAFFYLDLDDFKPVNDRHGHARGDEVLRIVASRLRHAVRKDDLVVRLGGDEFAIVQAGVGTLAAATALAKKIVAAVAAPIVLDDLQVEVGASIGIALRADLRGGVAEVSAAADRALYQAKAAGGRRWVVESAPATSAPPSS